MTTSKSSCLHCDRYRRVRGMCGRCYVRMRKLVLTGGTTWTRLESEGKALPVNDRRTSNSLRYLFRGTPPT